MPSTFTGIRMYTPFCMRGLHTLTIVDITKETPSLESNSETMSETGMQFCNKVKVMFRADSIQGAQYDPIRKRRAKRNLVQPALTGSGIHFRGN